MLRPDGIYVQNIIDQPPLRFLAADIATVRDVFAHVAVLGPPARFDRSAVATPSSSPATRRFPSTSCGGSSAADGAGDVVRVDAELDDLTDGAIVLTDEHAPVDQLLS